MTGTAEANVRLELIDGGMGRREIRLFRNHKFLAHRTVSDDALLVLMKQYDALAPGAPPDAIAAITRGMYAILNGPDAWLERSEESGALLVVDSTLPEAGLPWHLLTEKTGLLSRDPKFRPLLVVGVSTLGGVVGTADLIDFGTDLAAADEGDSNERYGEDDYGDSNE